MFDCWEYSTLLNESSVQPDDSKNDKIFPYHIKKTFRLPCVVVFSYLSSLTTVILNTLTFGITQRRNKSEAVLIAVYVCLPPPVFVTQGHHVNIQGAATRDVCGP